MNFLTLFKKNYLCLVAIFLACFLFVEIRINFFNPQFRTPDEFHYNGLAKVISEMGFVEGTRALMKQYLVVEWRWANPPPSRIGHIFLTSIVSDITGDASDKSGSTVAIIASIIVMLTTAFATFLLTKNWIYASVAVLLLASSAWEIAMARRSWTDDSMTAICGLLFCISILARNKFKKWHVVAFFLLTVIAPWFKESAPVVSAFFILMIGFSINFKDPEFARRLKTAVIFTVSWFSGLVTSYLILSFFLGGYDQIFIVSKKIAEAVPKAPYARDYQDGTPLAFFQTAFILVPGFCVCMFVATIIFLFNITNSKCRSIFLVLKNNNEKSFFLSILIISLLLITVASIPLYYKNLRYLSPLIVPLYVFVAIILCRFSNNLALAFNKSKFVYTLSVVIVFAVVAIDLYSTNVLIQKFDLIDLNYRFLSGG